MARGICLSLLMAIAVPVAAPAAAHGPRGRGLFGRPHPVHPINAWMGSRRPRLR